jgi:hypothetical protein
MTDSANTRRIIDTGKDRAREGPNPQGIEPERFGPSACLDESENDE